MMKDFWRNQWLKIIGVLVGGLVGYIYYYYIGCVTGTCPITSNPFKMIIIGSLFGFLFFDLFSKKKVPENVSNMSKDNDINI